MTEEIVYLNEWIWPGKLGNTFINLAFLSALFSVVAYTLANRNFQKGLLDWKQLGRALFVIHTVSILSIIGIIFFIMLNHRFEYYYVWQHTNTEMLRKYIFASFWEGQEGSFLLWMFWHVVIGCILLFTAKKWESPVMAIIALVQVFLVSMIMGIVVEFQDFFYKIGTNPFTLLREHPDMVNLPFTQNPNYLANLDGRGLNPLLQNYWMTIHPPTLFLGFAATVVPFAYAIAGLWNRNVRDWIKPALPWTFFAVGILGGGILMGGAWAYEALSFGGFWAWDPVENASLVPWLTLTAGAHLMLISRNKGTSLFLAFFLIVISFVLILYSTFLTRSGVLGEASVHSFTDLGMTGQLLFYLLFFAALPVVFIIPDKKIRNNYLILGAVLILFTLYFGFTNAIVYAYLGFAVLSLVLSYVGYKKIFPQTKEEDGIYTREFALFIGALIFLLSAFQIIFYTSIPALGKAFGTVPGLSKLFPENMAPSTDAIEVYNAWQLPFAVILTFFIAITQFLRYKVGNPQEFYKQIKYSLFSSVAITLLILAFTDFQKNILYILLLFTTLFAVLSNLDYAIRFMKGKWRLIGPSVAHIGFALILLGSLISAGHQKVISANKTLINLESLNEEFKNNENIMLHKNDTLPMGDFFVVFTGDSLSADGVNAYYQVQYFKPDKTGNLQYQFTLHPRVQLNDRMGNVAEPSTLRKWNKDIFTHVAYADLEKIERLKKGKNDDALDTEQFKEAQFFEISEGDTIAATNCLVVFEKLTLVSEIDLPDENTLSVDLLGTFTIVQLNKDSYSIQPGFSIIDNRMESYPAFDEKTGLKISIQEIIPEKRKVRIAIAEKVNNKSNEFIIMKAIVFPGINILWLGCILMVIGIFMSVARRITS